MDVATRFWAKVEKTDTCWLWTANRVGTGRVYGQVTIAGRKLYAHRVAYELLVGPIPEGLDLDHLCRVRHCVNPAHLEPVTRRVNTLRGVGPAALRARQTHCAHGHAFDVANTHRESDGTRRCRACRRERLHIYRSQRRAA